MKLDVFPRLILGIRRLFLQEPQNSTGLLRLMAVGDEERDQSAREYELYYWSSASGPWY